MLFTELDEIIKFMLITNAFFLIGIARFCVLRQLTELNASQNLIKLLTQQSGKEVNSTDPFLHEIIWVLGQLSQKG